MIVNPPITIKEKEVKEYKIKAPTKRGILLSLLRIVRENKRLGVTLSNLELEKLIEEAIRQDTEVKNKIKNTVKLEGWKGKSSIEVIEEPNSFKVITWQKKDQESEPSEIINIVTKEEVNLVIASINQVNKEIIDTKDIADKWCRLNEVRFNKEGKELFTNNEFNWQLFSGSRALYLPLNVILRLLDYYGFTKYRAGKTKILKKIVDINKEF